MELVVGGPRLHLHWLLRAVQVEDLLVLGSKAVGYLAQRRLGAQQEVGQRVTPPLPIAQRAYRCGIDQPPVIVAQVEFVV